MRSRGPKLLEESWPRRARPLARRDESTRNQLTPQELQIALLLTSGNTTRQTAAALFLSPKTVEYHLRSVYRKLGCNNRDELSSLLRSVGGGADGR